MSTELTKLASDAALAQLWQQRAEVHAQAGLPARMSPQWWQARGLHAVGQGGVPSNVFSQLSPGGGRVSVATHHSVGALDGRLQIDIYDAFSLERISSFLLDAPRRVVDGTDRTCARVLRWLDDAHLVLGFDDGWLRIYDGVGALCSEARIGAHVEAIARCAGKLAVGLFPGLPANAVAVGIKVFAMDALLAGRFEPEVFLPCDLRAGVPHTLRLDPDGSTIWLKGARTIHSDRSSTIWIDRMELPHGRRKPLVVTPHTKERHEISEVSDCGELVVCTDDEAHLVNRQGETLARLTTRHPLPPRVRPLGGRRYLMATHRLWLLDFAAQELRPIGPDVGRVADVWPLADGSIVAVTRGSGLCELTRFDPNTAAILAHSQRGPVRHIDEHAVAHDYAGRLHVGDYQGELHRFDAGLHSLPSLTPQAGPIQHLVSDPTRNRVGVVGASSVMRWVAGDDVTTQSLPESARVDLRRDYESIDITPEGEVFLSIDWPGLRARLSGGSYWKFNREGEVRCLRRRSDGPPTESGLSLELVATFRLPHKQRSHACTLAGHPVTIRSDGTVVVYEPTPPIVPAGDANKLPVLIPDGTRELASGFDDPKGIIAVGPYEVVIWSAKRIHRLQLDPALTRIVAQRSAESERIGAISVDPRSGGLVSTHGSHLAFWGPELDERYRLALLEDKTALWHVLHPSEPARPGWLWRDGGFEPWVASLFETRDADRRAVTDPSLHEAFVAARFSESRVELARQDYAAFVRDLADTRESFAGQRLTLLLTACNGGQA